MFSNYREKEKGRKKRGEKEKKTLHNGRG